jgi:thiamine-phosphate pyrophosphorylase
LKPIPSPLYVICDAEACERAGWTLIDFAAACLDGGATFLQVRAKRASSGWLLDCTEQIVQRAATAGGVEVIVNDRADIARLSGASGVHVGQDDLSPRAVRNVVGDKFGVGLSTHTSEQVDAALHEPVSYIAIGPIFGTTSKETGYEALGLSRVRAAAGAAAACGMPVVAIGGITLDRAAAVIEQGASAVAVIGGLMGPHPDRRVREYLQRLGR